MRSISVSLYQNLGSSGAIGNQLSVSSYPVESIGNVSWEVDSQSQLTRVSPSDVSVRFTDPTGSAWTFIQTQLQITNGLLPPYLALIVDGVMVFTGIVDPNRIIRHQSASSYSLELSANDWSTELSNTYLASQNADGSLILLWSRPKPNTFNATPPSIPSFTGYSVAGCLFYTTPFNGVNDTFGVGGTLIQNMQYSNWVVYLGDATQKVSIGDQVTDGGGLTWSVASVMPVTPSQVGSNGMSVPFTSIPGYNGSLSVIILTGNQTLWTNSSAEYGGGTNIISTCYYQTFTPVAHPWTASAYYTVQQTDTNNYLIYLDTVNGIVPGDVLTPISGSYGGSYTVMSINPENYCLTVKESPKGLNNGISIYFDQSTMAELVMVDSRTTLNLACNPFTLDATQLEASVTTIPVFGYLANIAVNQNPISDLEPTLTGINFISGLNLSYAGSVDTGLTHSTLSYPLSTKADWTSQTLTAPSSLMPYEIRALSPQSRMRNHAYNQVYTAGYQNGPVPNSGIPALSGQPATVPWTWIDPWVYPTNTAYQVQTTFPTQILYDYLQMRKITLVQSPSVSLTNTPWTGTSWGSPTALTNRFGVNVQALSVFPGGPSGSILAITSGGLLQLDLLTGASIISMPLPPGLTFGATLITTPYGAYVVSPQGYALIKYSGGGIDISNFTIFGSDIVSQFYPSTFCQIDTNTIFCLGYMITQDGSHETWAYQLATTPVSNPTLSVILSQKIRDGLPIYVQAMRDPSKAGRLVGHLGGSPFTVDNKVPTCIERFTPSGQTALDLIEHICQVQNAIAIPHPSGKIIVKSRINTDTVINLTGILQESIDDTLCWQDFYSLILVETQDGKYWTTAQGQTGGNLLTVSGHPLISNVATASGMADQLVSWFGKTRQQSEQQWTYPLSTQTPWDTLHPFDLITVNGSIPYRVMKLENDYVFGKASITLIQN